MDDVALKRSFLLRLVRTIDTLKLRLSRALKLLVATKIVLVLVAATTSVAVERCLFWT